MKKTEVVPLKKSKEKPIIIKRKRLKRKFKKEPVQYDSYQRWTPAEEKKLLNAKLDNPMTLAQIAAEFFKHRTVESVMRKWNKLYSTLNDAQKARVYKMSHQAQTNSKYRMWTPEKEDWLRNACQSGKYTYLADIVEEFNEHFKENVSISAIKSQKTLRRIPFVRNSQVQIKSDVGNYFASVEDPQKQIKREKELWDLREVKSQEVIRDFLEESNIYRTFPINRYIGIAFDGDAHFGPAGVDYTMLRVYAETIKDTPWLFSLKGGDFLDNFITFATLGASAPTDEQMLFNQFLRFHGDTPEEQTANIIAMLRGNHDARTENVAGFDIIKLLIRDKKIAYSPSEARLTIDLNGQEYKIAARHQYRFNSTLNYCHTVKRFWDMGEKDFDIGVVFHNHTPAGEYFERHREQKLAVRPGTAKIVDRWAKDKGFNSHNLKIPVVILNPKEKDFVLYMNFGEAVDTLIKKNQELEEQEYAESRKKVSVSGRGTDKRRSNKKNR